MQIQTVMKACAVACAALFGSASHAMCLYPSMGAQTTVTSASGNFEYDYVVSGPTYGSCGGTLDSTIMFAVPLLNGVEISNITAPEDWSFTISPTWVTGADLPPGTRALVWTIRDGGIAAGAQDGSAPPEMLGGFSFTSSLAPVDSYGTGQFRYDRFDSGEWQLVTQDYVALQTPGAPVPEPETVVLMGIGLVALSMRRSPRS